MLTDDNFHDMILAPLVNDSKAFDTKIKDEKWIDKDLSLAKQIISKCHRSVFAENEDNIKVYQPEKLYIDFLCKILTDSKYDATKNIQLGIGPIFLKDTKFFKHKNYEDKEFSYMYSSCPVDIHLLEQQYTQKAVEQWMIDQCKTENLDFVTYSFFESKSNQHWCCFYFSKNGNMYSNGTYNATETNIFLQFIANELKHKQEDITQFLNIPPIHYVYSKHSVNRKIMVPILEKFFSTKKEDLNKSISSKK
jgi:hypothetical protein